MITTTQEEQIEKMEKKMKLAAKQIRDKRNGKIPRYNWKEELDKIDSEIEEEESGN